jgi:hypothetical protein
LISISEAVKSARYVAVLSLACVLGLSSTPALADLNPLTRVVRLSAISGSVSLSPAGSEDWVQAPLNRPLVQGDRLWLRPGDRAELHLGSTAIRLAGEGGLEILGLTDEDLQLKLVQGSVSLRVRDLGDKDTIELDTPNIAFQLNEPGEYRIDADPGRDHTLVQVRQGLGVAFPPHGARQSLSVGAGQRMGFSGGDLFVYESGRMGPRDDFDRWVAQRDGYDEADVTTRYVSRDMTGYEDLDAYGDWRIVDAYGPVWMPRVSQQGWAPYQFGHWAWIEPWGWTWIDDAPWGFAPFHYGRWAFISGRWGWIPGPADRRPVYAPALVVFTAASGGGFAWWPLAPGEPYHPGYAHDDRYLDRINRGIPSNRRIYAYENQRAPHAVGMMPEDDFKRGVRPAARPDGRNTSFADMQVREALPPSPTMPHGARVQPSADPLPVMPSRQVNQPERHSEQKMTNDYERPMSNPTMPAATMQIAPMVTPQAGGDRRRDYDTQSAGAGWRRQSAQPQPQSPPQAQPQQTTVQPSREMRPSSGGSADRGAAAQVAPQAPSTVPQRMQPATQMPQVAAPAVQTQQPAQQKKGDRLNEEQQGRLHRDADH